MRKDYLFVGLWLIMVLSCQDDHSLRQIVIFPKAENLEITWEVLDDAIAGDDKRTLQFSVTNHSDTLFPRSGWRMYYNQFPHTLYSDLNSLKNYQVSAEGGDLYSIAPSDSFPGIAPGGTYDFRYQTNFNIFRYTFTPKGLFFVIDGLEQAIDVGDPAAKVFGTDFTFTHVGGTKPIYRDPADRYTENEDVVNVGADEQSPFIPTPYYYRRKNEIFVLRSSINIYHDAGLEEEASYLGEQLNQLLGAPPRHVTPDQDTAHVYLRQAALEIGGRNEEVYTLDIDLERGIEITGSDRAGVFYGLNSLLALIDPNALGETNDSLTIPAILVEDRPRFTYRGLHFDVARNYNGLSQIYDIIRLMSMYKLNKLHLHLTDDEGWRLEIPGLPELTDVGSQRGWSPTGELLVPAYGSGGQAGNLPGSGYISRQQFIELLQYAKTHHVDIIPEINGPGHARAAIRAMRIRHDRLLKEGQETLAREYLLEDLNDQSEYSSAQEYNDNVMCVCQEYTYTFFEKVIAEVVKMYREADAPLNILHTGSDEVPQGAWTKSPECEKLIAREADVHSAEDLHPYFLRRLDMILDKFDLVLAGWEEIVLKHVSEGNEVKLAPNLEFLGNGFVPFVWNSIVGWLGEDLAYQLANAGYQVVLSHATNLYLDMAYTYEPEEPGLSWAGFVDTKNVFEFTPFDLFQTIYQDDYGNDLDRDLLLEGKTALQPEAERNVLGIQGQLWSEALRTPGMVEYALLPKMLALAERAWSPTPSWLRYKDERAVKRDLAQSWSRFASRLGQLEFKRLDKIDGGFAYRLPPPGAKIENGHLYANVSFPGLTIRYTVDGSDPNPFSPQYTEPVDLKPGAQVKLRTFNSSNRASRMVVLDGSLLK